MIPCDLATEPLCPGMVLWGWWTTFAGSPRPMATGIPIWSPGYFGRGPWLQSKSSWISCMGFYMVLPCLHVTLSLPVLCYCFWYIIYKFVCLNLLMLFARPYLCLDCNWTRNLLLQLGLQCGLTGQTWHYSMDYYIVTQRERNTWFITILVWFYFSMCVCVSCYS